MGHAISTSGIRNPRNYVGALAHFEKIQPWRGYDANDPRPIADTLRRKKHMTVRKLHDGSIAYRLYHTDVVIYHPNGDVTINGYSSKSTNAFVDCLAPAGMSPHFDVHDHIIWIIDHTKNGEWWERRTGFSMGHKATRLVPRAEGGLMWAAHESTPFGMFKHYVLDKKAAREARKATGYDDFAPWLRAASALMPFVFDDERRYPLHLLADRAEWLALARQIWPKYKYIDRSFGRQDRKLTCSELADRALDRLRRLIHRAHNCVVCEQEPWVDSWQQLRHFRRSESRY